MIKTQEQTTHAGRKTQEDFFIKYFTSHLYLEVSKGLFQVCVWEEAGDRPLLKYFDPEVMAVSVVSFSFSMVSQPEHWSRLGAGFSHYTRLPPQLYSPVSTGSLNPTDRNSTVLCSIRRPYITFKLPRGDMDTPLQLLPISSDRDVSPPLSLEWPVWSSSCGNNCHPVQRSLSSGASVYESIMGSFLPRPISSANFRPRDFLS